MTSKDTLTDLLEAYQDGHRTRTALYQNMAERLSEIAGKTPHWKGDYIQAVASGTLDASRPLARAIEALAAETDGTPAIIANTEPVTVHARPGTIQAGALLIGESIPCAYPPCPTHFVKTHPRMKYCPIHRDPRSRRYPVTMGHR